MTLAQEGSVLMKSAADTKLESSTSTQESWDWGGGEKRGTVKMNGESLEFHGMGEEATHWG